jgi:hypothetical protein
MIFNDSLYLRSGSALVVSIIQTSFEVWMILLLGLSGDTWFLPTLLDAAHPSAYFGIDF